MIDPSEFNRSLMSEIREATHSAKAGHVARMADIPERAVYQMQEALTSNGRDPALEERTCRAPRAIVAQARLGHPGALAFMAHQAGFAVAPIPEAGESMTAAGLFSLASAMIEDAAGILRGISDAFDPASDGGAELSHIERLDISSKIRSAMGVLANLDQRICDTTPRKGRG